MRFYLASLVLSTTIPASVGYHGGWGNDDWEATPKPTKKPSSWGSSTWWGSGNAGPTDWVWNGWSKGNGDGWNVNHPTPSPVTPFPSIAKPTPSPTVSCKDPEAYCGMTISKGESFTLEKDLFCTKDTDGRSDHATAITVEEGAILRCDGYSIVQVNDEVGMAVGCSNSLAPVTGCGLSWGIAGVRLESGARVEGCKITGWKDGLMIEPEAGSYDDKIEIQDCEATLNTNGLKVGVQNEGNVVNYSIENSVFSYNRYGIRAHNATSEVNMEDVKSISNARNGIDLNLAAGSDVILDYVEANYNKQTGIKLTTFEGGSTVNLTNVAANYNAIYGLELSLSPDQLSLIQLDADDEMIGNGQAGIKAGNIPIGQYCGELSPFGCWCDFDGTTVNEVLMLDEEEDLQSLLLS